MKLHTFFAALAMAVLLPVQAQKLAVLSDVHVVPGFINGEKLQVAVDEINAGDFDAVVLSGDLANEGSDVELKYVKSILDGIRQPLYVIPGNHESTWSQSATKTFVDLWGSDRFVAELDSLVIVGMSCGPYMKMGDGHIKQEDFHWLRSTLDSVVCEGKRVLSFNHYPLLPELDNCQTYVELLEQYPVIGHFNGHEHEWHIYNAGGPESGSDLPCVMVRALDRGKGDYGYTEVEVDPQWVHVYNKPLGQPRESMYAFPARSVHKKAKFPEPAPLVVPDGFTVDKVWTDSASVFTRIGFDGERIYFGNSLGQVRAVNKADGTEAWNAETGASLFSRPVALRGGKVAVPMHDGIMILDARNGRLIKKYNSEEGPYVADGSITPDGKGYIQGAFKRIERRDARSGKKVWSYDSIFNYCQAEPAIDGNDLVFGAWDTNLRCLDLRSGRLKWVWNNGRRINLLGPGNVVPVIAGDRVYVVAPDRYMTAIDRATGRQLWRDKSYTYRESLGHSEDFSRIYAKTMDGELVAVDATVPEFKALWVTDLGLGYEHAPCIVAEKDGYVYTGSRRGIVTVSKADGSGLVAQLPLGVSEVNGIDIDPVTGDVYVSLIEGTIYRIARK